MTACYQVLRPKNLEKTKSLVFESLSFTPREVDILSCLLSGRSFKSIALVLALSPKTIEAHMRNILSKMQCHTREGVISRLEGSATYDFLKQHYFQILLIKNKLETLEKLSPLFQRQKITYQIIAHDRSSQEIALQCQKDLLSAGIQSTIVQGSKTPPTKTADVIQLFSKEGGKQTALCWGAKPKKFETLPTKPYEIALLEGLKASFKDSASVIDSFLKKNTNYQKVPFGHTEESSKRKKRSFLPWLVIGGSLLFILLFLIKLFYSPNPTLSNLYMISKDKLLMRTGELQKIATVLKKQDNSEENPIVALVGIGGSGKTTLARIFAHQSKSSLTWELNAQTVETFEKSLEDLANSTSNKSEKHQKTFLNIVRNFSGKERTQKLLEFIKDHLRQNPGWILIYDDLNCESTILQDYFFQNPDYCGTGKVIITTRNANIKLFLDYRKVLPISPLGNEEKVILFRKHISKELSNQKETLTLITKSLPPFPLDIASAAHYMDNNSLDAREYLQRLKDHDREFSKIQKGFLKLAGPYDKTRYSILSQSLQNILKEKGEFLDLLYCLSLINNKDIPVKLLETYHGKLCVDELLRHLKKHSFIINITLKEGVRVFAIHESFQEFLKQYFQHTLTNQQKKEQGSKLFEVFKDHLEEKEGGVSSISEAKFIRILIEHSREILTSHGILNQKNSTYLTMLLGYRYSLYDTPLMAEKFLKKAFEISKQKKLRLTYIFSNRLLGLIYMLTGQADLSLKHLSDSLEDFYKYYPDDYYRICRSHMFLGYSYRVKGSIQKALQNTQKALKIAKQKNNKFLTGMATTYLGFFYNDLKRYEEAEILLKAGQELFRENERQLGWASSHLGYTFVFTSRHKEAEEVLNKSYRLYKSAHGEFYFNVGWIQGIMGLNYGFLGEFNKAHRYLKKSYQILERIFGKDHFETTRIIQYMGVVAYLEGRYAEAKELLERALKIFEKTNHLKMDLSLEYLKKIEEKEKSVMNK